MKKIDLHISKYGELSLISNPDLGNYIINTIKIDDTNFSNFVESIKRIIPYWFTYEVISDNSIKIYYNDIDFTVYVESIKNKNKNKNKNKIIIYSNAIVTETLYLNQNINTFNLFKKIFNIGTEHYYNQLKLADLLNPLINKINSFVSGLSGIINYTIERYRDTYYDDCYRLKLELLDQKYKHFLIQINNDEIKFIGQLIDSDYGFDLETIDYVESKLKNLGRRLNQMNHIKSLIEEKDIIS